MDLRLPVLYLGKPCVLFPELMKACASSIILIILKKYVFQAQPTHLEDQLLATKQWLRDRMMNLR